MIDVRTATLQEVRPVPGRSPSLLALLLALLVAALVGAPGHGATSCSNAPCSQSCSPDPPVAISTLVAPGDFPTGASTPIAFVDPGDHRGRWLIATQEGVILIWDGATQSILPTPFLDLRDDVGGPVLAEGERGLLSLTVDPDYATTGQVYVFYTRANQGSGTTGDVVIARYTRSAGDPDVGNAASALTILVIDHPASNHNGGSLVFGPDGFLYISTGDGGGGCDSNAGNNGDGQRPDTLAGKILRLDVRGIDGSAGAPDDCGIGGGNYTVPSTNPFFGQEPACDEVWALGLRNPFRFSFDRLTGDLFIGDVGQDKWEEINLKAASTPAPVNFGWVCREGCETSGNNESQCSTGGCPLDTGTSCQFPRPTGGYWDPILCHSNPGGWGAIMGGYRYRGSHVPSISGDYFYGDAGCGQIWKTTTLNPSNPAAISSSCWASGHDNYGFAEDSSGELYIIRGGFSRIECIHNGDGCFWAGSGIFADGFESGNTSGWSAVVP